MFHFIIILLTFFTIIFTNPSYSFSDPRYESICRVIKQNYYDSTVLLSLAKKRGYSTDAIQLALDRHSRSYDRNYCWDHFGLIETLEGVNQDPDFTLGLDIR